MKTGKFLSTILILAAPAVLIGTNIAFAQCYGAGYAHLDVSWRWSVNEGINKMRNTTVKQLKNMDEYPFFRFSFDNPLMYEWMEIYYPDLFSQIKRRIAEGRWEPISGMWTDPMIELVDGEQLARQWLTGKRYIKDEFGFEIKVGSDVDQYGAWPGGNMPQIAKKCGIEYYTFVRGLTDTDGRFFWWRGNDGTRIFSHDTDFWFNCPEGTCGCSSTTPAIKYYGAGDGGGGPFPDQAAVCGGGTDSCGRFIDFFEDAAAKGVPASTTLTAEGYSMSPGGIGATGILTHRPFLKWYNRKNTCKLLEAEKFSVFAKALRFNHPAVRTDIWLGGCKSGESGNFNYPQRDLNLAQKRFMLWQHHDNLPGNFTWDGVNIARNELEIAYRTFESALDSALLTISARVNTEGEGTSILIFNSLSWPRTEAVEINLDQAGGSENVEVVDVDGGLVPSQISADGKKKIVFIAENVPATGYKIFRAVPAAPASGTPSGSTSAALKADPKNLVFENEFFILEMDAKTGFWKRVYDKANGKEALDGGGNILGASPNDAWPYGEGFDEWGADLGDADSIEVVESGPARVKVRVRHGVVFQDTMMYAGVNRIDCFFWSKNYTEGGPAYLRVVFNLNVADGVYTTEGPYGYAESPDRNTGLEKPTLSWQDLSGADYGASLINDSRYGGDRDKNSIKLSLIGRAEFDDQQALYSLYPHGGGWRDGLTPRASYEVNFPLIVRKETNHDGELPESASFLEAAPANVIVSVIKKHEDSDDTIVRMFETTGKKTSAKLIFNGGVTGAREIDMMEWNEIGQALSITDEKTVNVEMNPYEIKTLRVKLPAYYGNNVSAEMPKKIILVQGTTSSFNIRLSNARQTDESVNLNLNFPEDSGMAPVSLSAELKSGETKELAVKIGKPEKASKGEAALEISYGSRKETKKAPFEVMPSIPKLENGELVLYNVWEAESMGHKTGSRVVDADAGNGIAWRGAAGDRENDHLVFGPYEELPEGRYVVSFRMKVGEKVNENLAAVDVFVSPKEVASLSQVKTKKNISGADFGEAGVYREFPLMFRQPENYKDEFRVFWYGKTSLWIDRITVFKVVGSN